jgi:Flp pilus assembly protein TadD
MPRPDRGLASDHASRAAERLRAGDHPGAERLYRDALAIEPDQPDALHGLGCLAHASGDHARAIALIGRALQAAPRTAHFHIVLGLALLAAGHTDAARAALTLACTLEPRDPRAHAAHGRILATAGRTAEALAAFDHALSLDPANPETQHERASLLLAAGQTEAAAQAFRTTHALRPDDPVTAANLGAALNALNRPEEAEPLLTASLVAAPNNAATLSTRGLARLALARLDDALADLAQAHALAPHDPAIARHLALGHYERDERPAARALLEPLVARDPHDHQARYNLGILDLAEGNLERGWQGYESRRSLAGPARALNPAALTLTAEQGLGDTIQFLRYAPLAAARTGAPIRLAVPDALRRAVASLNLPLIEPGRAGDDTMPLASLPRLFSPTLDTIPPPFRPWFDRRTAERWTKRLHALAPGLLHVGLAWAGSPSYRQDRRRSIPPALLEPLTRLPGIRLVSLQRGATLDGVLDPAAELQDLAETAALITALDLVITVDTAIVHLAAGLGKPVWLLDRLGGDWRWLRGRTDSPWYPSVRIFRAETYARPEQSWPRAIALVCVELKRPGALPLNPAKG